MISKRAQSVKPSATLFLVAKAKDLAAQGHDVISLSVGEPDWNTFGAAAQAGIEAIQSGFTKYTAAAGIPELRQVICDQVKRELNLDYSVKQATVATGAKYIIYSALQALLDPGDEVLLQTPYWVSYPIMTEMSGGVPVMIDCSEHPELKITPQTLRKSLTARSKVFILNSPSNPTGIVYSKEELADLAAVLREFPKVVILSDDIYNRLLFDPAQKLAPHLLQVAPDLKDRTVIINGVAKSYSMTGWRIGWALGPDAIITAMSDYQSQTTSSPCSVSQKAALAAVVNCDDEAKKASQMLRTRLQSALDFLAKIPDLKVLKPQGAFYLWLDLRPHLGKSFDGMKVADSRDFSKVLLEKFFVATVPGEEFGTPGFLRLSFAIEEKRMREALSRLQTFISQLKK